MIIRTVVVAARSDIRIVRVAPVICSVVTGICVAIVTVTGKNAPVFEDFFIYGAGVEAGFDETQYK